MKEIKVEIIQGRGSYYNLGMLQGLLHKGTKLEENHLKRRKRSIRSYEANQRQAKTYYDLFAPGLWSELEGLSEGLEWSLEDIVHEYSGYQQNWDKTGCSALMQNGVYVRNYDYHPKTYEGRFLLFQPDQGFASVGFGTRMIGRMDGMNEKVPCSRLPFCQSSQADRWLHLLHVSSFYFGIMRNNGRSDSCFRESTPQACI
ncbi:C45 family autoproteolytic acyltransferase/hydrolase [Priestia flexa]|nr:C45 family autoproteolytic acyltransferase/hydrolase [Priestia flexa]